VFPDGWQEGRAFVPAQLYDKALHLYTKDVCNGITHYISEQPSPVCRFHIGLDMTIGRNEKFPDLRQIHAYVRSIQMSVAKFYAISRSRDEFLDAVVLWVLVDPLVGTKRARRNAKPPNTDSTERADQDADLQLFEEVGRNDEAIAYDEDDGDNDNEYYGRGKRSRGHHNSR